MPDDVDSDLPEGQEWTTPVVRRLRDDPGFMWLPGGPARQAFTEGNGQPQRDRGWGLWRTVTRPDGIAEQPTGTPGQE